MEQEIQVKAFQNAYYTLTPTKSGTVKLLTVEGVGANSYAVATTYKTEADSLVDTSWSFIDNSLSFQVEAGRVYYITLFFPMQDWTFKATMSEEFKLVSVAPENGGIFYITSNNNAAFTFSSSSVTFTEGEVLANGNLIKIYNFDDYNDLVSSGIFTYTEEGTSGVVNWNGNLCGHFQESLVIEFISLTGHGSYNVLYRLFEEGKLNAGDKISLTLHGVKDNLSGKLLNGDGNLEVSWSFAGAPTVLVKHDVPKTIYSWYNEGDLSGVAAFTFSRDIKSARAFLEMGQGEGANDLYQEELPAEKITYDGKTVVVDFSGVMRTKATMNLKYNWDSFCIKLADVVDIDGNSTLSEDQGTLSSYTFYAKYKDISASLSSEFIPLSGTTLSADTKNIEIWFNNSNLITWDGITFTYYTEEGGELISHEVFVKKEDCTVEEDNNETVITVKIPEGLYKAANIRVAVNVTGSTDGTAHVITAYYNTNLSYDLDLTRYANPPSGSTISYLNEINLSIGMTHAINKRIEYPVIVKGKNTGVTAYGTIVDNGMMSANIVLDDIFTAADTYVITIAEGAIGDYVYGESGYTTGLTNKECTLTYIVDGKYDGKPVDVYPAEGTVAALQDFSFTFFQYTLVAPTWDNNAKPYIQNADGEKTYLEFTPQTEASNTVCINLSEPILNAGEYTIVLPAGSVCNGTTGDPFEEEFRFTYIVSSTSAINNINEWKGNANVYDINGRALKTNSTKNLAPGLYIVNGNKVVVK